MDMLAAISVITTAFLWLNSPAMIPGPFVAMQAVLPPKPIQVKPGDASAAASAAAAAAPAPAGGSGHHYPPATPLQTPPYSALRTPRTPALLDAFGKSDSTITHFAPPDAKGLADHTLKTLGLAFNMYETYLGCKFPYKALQTVSHHLTQLLLGLLPSFQCLLLLPAC